MGGLESLALAVGSAWAAGINLYATILVLGVMDLFGLAVLPDELAVLSSPMVLGAAALLFCIEFVADKIPGVDSLWDMLHTFIRIPAGAYLAASTAAGMDFGLPEETAYIAALLVGGAISGGSHLSKATSRAAINTSPEPFTNWFASFVEDIVAVGAVILAVFAPVVLLSFVGVFILLAVWLLPKLIRTLVRLFRGRKPEEEAGSGLVMQADRAPGQLDPPD